jgi:2-polyprenyl-3-methyl-5-hydroxy-6-metoxy-1,4-benzoquinol methylase
MAIGRVVRPEILDSLPVDDPAAQRSRRDLRLINAMMGNFHWVERQIERIPAATSLVEIGAGEGMLSTRLARKFPEKHLTAIDLAPCPKNLAGVTWRQGDLFQILPELSGDVLLGVMIVHHFSDKQLAELGRALAAFRVLVFCEPWRAFLPEVWGGVMWPIVGEVTRHDMPVSVRAGFRPGELPRLLNLANWKIEEAVDWRGSMRLVAWRQ